MKRRPLRGLYAPELLESRIAPATFIVTTIADGGVGSLRQAVADAEAHKGADTITFAASVTAPIVLTSELVITDTITIKGSGPDKTIISGDSLVRIFKIGGLDHTKMHPANISGLTLLDGHTGGSGGAVYSTESLTMSNVVVAGCYANFPGGGVWANTPGKVSMTHVTFADNEAKTSDGGGIYARAALGVSINGCLFTGNKAVGTSTGNGGGICLKAIAVPGKTPGAVTVTGTTFLANSGNQGGGIFVDIPGGKVTISKSVFTGNTAEAGGGGLYLKKGAISVAGSAFSHNTAAHFGGAIMNIAGDSLAISNSSFDRNTAGDLGGAIHAEGGNPVTVSSSIFSGQTAPVGGAIHVEQGVHLTVKGSQFFSNNATGQGGGAIDVATPGTTLTLSSSILSGNSGSAIRGTLGATISIKGGSFLGNESLYGGAILTAGSGTNAVDLTITGTLFQGNTAGEGGAIVAGGDGHISMTGVKVIGNQATGSNGGAMYLRSTTSIAIAGSLFSQNRAQGSGGALEIVGAAVVKGSKFLDNTTRFDSVTRLGGAIFLHTGTLTLTASTVTGNISGTGGGIDSDGPASSVTTTGSKIFGNWAIVSPNIHTAS